MFCFAVYIGFFNSRVTCFTGVFCTELEENWHFSGETFSLILFAPQARSEAKGRVPNRKCHFGHSEQERDWDRSLCQCFRRRGERGGIPVF